MFVYKIISFVLVYIVIYNIYVVITYSQLEGFTMTLQQLRYIVEIYKTGSITKAAANLFMSQPNLSSAIKELESEIDTSIFVRTTKGVFPTQEGEQFISYVQSILSQIDRLEFIFKNQKSQAVTLNIACVRSSYVAKTISDYYNSIPKDSAINLHITETTPIKVMETLANSEADIGRVSFLEQSYKFFNDLVKKNRLIMEVLWKAKSYVLISSNNPLAEKAELNMDMLKDYTRIYYNDLEYDIVPIDGLTRTIAVNERSTMMDILESSHDCYLWTISTHPDTLKIHNLVAKPCKDAPSVIEAIVYHKDKPRTKEAQEFIEEFKGMRYYEYFHMQEPFNPETIL